MTIDFTTPPEQQSPLSPELERLARKRASARLGWYRHATIYAIVITGLALLTWSKGEVWVAGPALGWGLGLALHGMRVFFADLGTGLNERLVQGERQRLINRIR